MTDRDFDLLVLGHETEGVLAAVAAGRAGARAAILVPPGRVLGGLLTEGGLAYVDRDARHLRAPGPEDGLFGEFLARAGVRLVALDPGRGAAALREMLHEAGAAVLEGVWDRPVAEGDLVRAVRLGAAGQEIVAGQFLDATPDGDFLAALGEDFAFGFREYGTERLLGVSPLPVVRGVTPAEIVVTCERLAADPDLLALKERLFGQRCFLDLENGEDYILIGPPYLALAYLRWREREGFALPFEADGFNVAVLGADTTSWNGLIYFESDPQELLAGSRTGAGAVFRHEVARFEAFLRTLWPAATAALPDHGLYVRQTRHALGTRIRLSLGMIARGDPVRAAGTFCYYPDFRGFRVTPAPRPLVARVALDAGLPRRWCNVAIASRAGGYTPPAHSLCRLVQYNATLGVALGVRAAVGDDLPAIRAELSRQGALADDQTGLAETPGAAADLLADPLLAREAALAVA